MTTRSPRPHALKSYSSEEVKHKCGEKWHEFEKIVAQNDADESMRILRHAIKNVTDSKDIDMQPLIEGGQVNFALNLFAGFLACFSKSKEPLEAYAELQEALAEVKTALSSEAARRHAMFDELRIAGASWREITVLTWNDWDNLSAGDRDALVQNLRENHKSYNKKVNPPSK